MKIFVYIESTFKYVLIATVLCIVCSCKQVYNGSTQKKYNVTAKEILGNPNYLAICYGGYRKNSREIQPTVNQLKQDLLILAAMNIKIVRTYNVHLVHASNVLKGISELK